MARLRRHVQPWQATEYADARLYQQLCALSDGALDERWECWIEGEAEEFVVVVAPEDASPSEPPFRYNGPDDAILRAFTKWLARLGERAHRDRADTQDGVPPAVSLKVIRKLGRVCPMCEGPFFEVEAAVEGSTQPFRYARCQRCEYGERLDPPSLKPH
jgi:hypothetical protein